MHADRDEQPTPVKWLTLAPAGLGVRWIVHLLPFDRSTNVTPIFEAVTRVPTPMHEDASMQAPKFSWPVGALGFGDGCTDHAEPEVAAGDAGETLETVGPTAPGAFAGADRGNNKTANNPIATTTTAQPRAPAHKKPNLRAPLNITPITPIPWWAPPGHDHHQTYPSHTTLGQQPNNHRALSLVEKQHSARHGGYSGWVAGTARVRVSFDIAG
jgi:hypothetical protein